MIKVVNVTDENRCPICGSMCEDYPNCRYGHQRGDDYDEYDEG